MGVVFHKAASGKGVTLFLFSVLLASSLSTGVSAEIVVETSKHTVGDWFEYDGYGNSLAVAVASEYSSTNGSGFVGWILNWDEPLRIEIIEKATCDIGDWSGTCLRSTGIHHLNITLEWTINSTQYDDDKLTLNITSEIRHEEPFSTSKWSFEQRKISTESWFIGDGEINLVETETTTQVTIESSVNKPVSLQNGDTWQSTVTTQKRDEVRQRINQGMWNESLAEREETQTVVYTVEDEANVNTAREDWPALRLRRQALGENNYSLTYLSELGWTIRAEEYENGTLTMSMSLGDYHSAAISGVRQTSVETPSLGLVATMGALLLGIIIHRNKGD